MSADSPNGRPLRARDALLHIAMVLGAAGAFLIGANAVNTSRFVPRPVEAEVRMRSGERAVADFVAEIDGHYELGIELPWDDSSDSLRAQVMTMEKPSTLDIRWSVTSDGTEVAAGTCEDYLYVGSTSFKRRVHDRVLGIAPYSQPWRRTVVRGVGRFETRAGSRYRVQADVGVSPEDHAPAEPRLCVLCVQIDRQFWDAHCARTTRLAYLGFVSLGGAFLSFAFWAFLSRRGK